jgi:hypothetical protein
MVRSSNNETSQDKALQPIVLTEKTRQNKRKKEANEWAAKKLKKD